MTSVTRVPETGTMSATQLSDDDARATLRRYGSWQLAKDSFARFRFGDGFTSSRALGLQLVFALLPLGIALVGLSASLHSGPLSDALREVLLRVTPGNSDSIVRRTMEHRQHQSGWAEALAIVFGFGAAAVAVTTSMGQVERGANRIYGISRDRSAPDKYRLALGMAFTAGLMSIIGFLAIVVGGTIGDVLGRTYGWSDTTSTVFGVLRFPVGILLALGSFALVLDRAPRRVQPGWSWTGIGAGISLALWVAFTYALALYVEASGSFGSTYGPLTGIVALLLWANLTSLALFIGIAFSAQLEAVRAGVMKADLGDPESSHP
jgi:YihY family inner membrane protein